MENIINIDLFIRIEKIGLEKRDCAEKEWWSMKNTNDSIFLSLSRRMVWDVPYMIWIIMVIA